MTVSRAATAAVTQPRCRSFAVVAAADARILVLGSMPGVASLQAQQYYAHPRNLFWPFMADILGFDPALPYSRRLAALRAHGIALWDVLAACERPGSLDGHIVRSSEIVNDFATFHARHPALARVCLNGGKAAETFRRHVQRASPTLFDGIEIRALPSTSPANAGQPRDAKLAQWRDALDGRSLPFRRS